MGRPRQHPRFPAAIGVGLAALGIYGIIARTTAQRTGEFGIRLALGAQVRDIIRLVLASGARLSLAGSALGLVGAFAIARLVGAFFPGMQASSAPVLAAVTLLLIAVGQIACYIPARSASRISPTEALRAEEAALLGRWRPDGIGPRGPPRRPPARAGRALGPHPRRRQATDAALARAP